MDSVISNKIANEAKSICASLTKLGEMIHCTNISSNASKNSKRGVSNPHASKQKKSKQPSKKKAPTNPTKKPSQSKSDATAAANDTSKRSKNKNT
jgi:hypothetical protein